nr:cuticle protein 10.9-like [Dermacentor andersoni]
MPPPQPYSFGYVNVDEYGNRQFRSEQGDSNNAKTGSYGYRGVNGLYRRVNYVADANGFGATVDTNEPGTAPGASADAVFNAGPVVPPAYRKKKCLRFSREVDSLVHLGPMSVGRRRLTTLVATAVTGTPL